MTTSFMEEMLESHHKIYSVTQLTVDLVFQSLEAMIRFLAEMTEQKNRYCQEESSTIKYGLVTTILVP